MKTLKFLALFFILLGCTKDDNNDRCKILLLRVDYMTNTFEGGHEQILSMEITDSDTIPIIVDYDPPGDFGNIKLYYEPTNELIFNGSIIWMGTGEIYYPESFLDPSQYSTLSNVLDLPDISRIQNLYYDIDDEPIDYSNIWGSINELEIVSEYLQSHKKIIFFLYTPSVGVGDPNTWDWFVIMNK